MTPDNVAKILKSLSSLNRQVFAKTYLSELMVRNSVRWSLEPGTTVDALIKQLLQENHLKATRFQFPGRAALIYSVGSPSLYEIALTLKPKGYFSHGSAAYLLGLTNCEGPIYLNDEQTPKPGGSRKLTQKRIDFAFRRPARVSNTVAEVDGRQIYLLSGMHTANLGVEEVGHAQNGTIRIANTERTLIDTAVRPAYSGGVTEVLNIYRNALARVNLSELFTYLKTLNFIYPYHQAIAFYLQRAGMHRRDISFFADLGMKFRFHLAHEMAETKLDPDWLVYYPKALDA